MATILTYNVQDGGRGREDALRTIITNVAPDVVLLQELVDEVFVRQLAASLHAQYFFAQSNTRFSLGLISRYPIRTAQSYRQFPIRSAVLEATLVLPSQQLLHLWGVHLTPHLAVPFELWRVAEVAVLMRRAQRNPRDLCCLVGDFNTIAPGERVLVHGLPRGLRRWVLAQGGRVYPWALAVLMRQRWHDCYRQMHPKEAGWTLPSHRPNARLDYVFANAPLASRLQRCEIVTSPNLVYQASDHLPVKAVFDIPTTTPS